MLEIIPIRAFKDNYIWAVICRDLNQVIVVDPGDGELVLNFLQQHHLELIAILVTHKHKDHIGGIDFLLGHYPGIPVYANKIENISQANQFVEEDDFVIFDKWPVNFRVITVPGHTLGHVSFYTDGILFCGDTLFGGGCGRVFEGTYEEMYQSLTKLSILPGDTLVYCAHEYTLANLKFAQHVEKDNPAIEARILKTQSLLAKNEPSVPSTMQLEKETNPFLRCKKQEVVKTVEDYCHKILNDEMAVFAEMRKWKNDFY